MIPNDFKHRVMFEFLYDFAVSRDFTPMFPLIS